jgi:hypothetical protein
MRSLVLFGEDGDVAIKIQTEALPILPVASRSWIYDEYRFS